VTVRVGLGIGVLVRVGLGIGVLVRVGFREAVALICFVTLLVGVDGFNWVTFWYNGRLFEDEDCCVYELQPVVARNKTVII
tara:strand:+ start:639 stop:881 length:243 start_codon:yes stop_codon:yes gene_type:complete